MRISHELRERTKSYASGVVRLFKALPVRDKTAQTLGLQLLRSKGIKLPRQLVQDIDTEEDWECAEKMFLA